MTNKKWYSSSEAGERLGIDRTNIWKNKDRLGGIRRGRQLVFQPNELTSWLKPLRMLIRTCRGLKQSMRRVFRVLEKRKARGILTSKQRLQLNASLAQRALLEAIEMEKREALKRE